ncbi:hypothetical protein ACHAQH_007377 [Verticillium albo-atrum]
MPSVSSLSQYTFINVGPLTTTWTPPASCTNGPTSKYLAPVYQSDTPLYGGSCDAEHDEFFDCVPQGEEIGSMWETWSSSPATFANPLPYHSPATICPSGWTTAGAATKSSNGDIEASGHFTQAETQFDALSTSDASPPLPTNPRANVFLEALAPGETIALCCPSGYDSSDFGNCYRNFPLSDFPKSTVCLRFVDNVRQGVQVTATFTYNGEEVTGMAITHTNTVQPTEDVIETFALSDVTAETITASDVWPYEGPFTGFEHLPMVTLVSGGNDTSESGEEGEGEEEESEVTETGESAARSGMITLGAGAGVLMAAWGAAALVGVGLMMPW